MPSLRNHELNLDFIEFLPKRSIGIYEIIAPLYKKGLSITDISDQTGIKRNVIWRILKNSQKELRPASSIPFTQWRKGRGKTGARPFYGFCYFEGEIVKDPKEYPTLILIQNLWKQGTSIRSIALKLDERKITSRMNKPWSYNVIKSIINRLKDGSIDYLISDDKSKNKKQNSKEVISEL